MAIWSIPESNKSVNVAPQESVAPDTPNFLEAESLPAKLYLMALTRLLSQDMITHSRL